MIAKLAWAVVLFFGCFAFSQETVIYQFGAAGAGDGLGPNGGLVFDTAGNIYGTTEDGGSAQVGTVFELIPSQDGNWQETILYNFCPGGIDNCLDGQHPLAGLVAGMSGSLYGTTTYGGEYGGGVVFELSPPSLPTGSWTEQVLWNFGAANDGKYPYDGLALDATGNLYGTTSETSTAGAGTVFELLPGQNGWTEALLHVFCLNYPDCSDGAQPMAGVTFDTAGNLYGTTEFGGVPDSDGWGLVYELSPTESGWSETVLKVFNSKTGGRTFAGITIDPEGHLYGGLSYGGEDGCGGVFVLKPFGLLPLGGSNGCSPQSDLVYSSGDLYGTAVQGGTNSQGVLFKLTKKGDHATQTVLYDFCQQANCADGSGPYGSPTLRNGQLYGATSLGGINNTGVIFQVAQ
jgi:uncharacterized repeat protein (TIGR03803 family)